MGDVDRVLFVSGSGPSDFMVPDEIGPGGGSFWIVVALMVIGVVLWFSMRRHLRRIDLPHSPSGRRPQIPIRGDDEPISTYEDEQPDEQSHEHRPQG
ncbi:MAG TPA: hypothetical protein VK053_20205 [Jiangellaceae bacterium]|nr:hypothetical protein [Jiangellaceae bacterium]